MGIAVFMAGADDDGGEGWGMRVEVSEVLFISVTSYLKPPPVLFTLLHFRDQCFNF